MGGEENSDLRLLILIGTEKGSRVVGEKIQTAGARNARKTKDHRGGRGAGKGVKKKKIMGEVAKAVSRENQDGEEVRKPVRVYSDQQIGRDEGRKSRGKSLSGEEEGGEGRGHQKNQPERWCQGRNRKQRKIAQIGPTSPSQIFRERQRVLN